MLTSSPSLRRRSGGRYDKQISPWHTEKDYLHTYIYIAGRVSMMRMLCPLSVLFLASVMSHPEYLFNYFCPVNLSFLILKYYRTEVIQKSKMAPTVQ